MILNDLNRMTQYDRDDSMTIVLDNESTKEEDQDTHMIFLEFRQNRRLNDLSA